MRPGIITSTLLGVVLVLQLVSLLGVVTSTQSRMNEHSKLAAVRQLDNSANNLVTQAQQFLSPITSQLSISRQLVSDGMLNTYKGEILERYFLSQLRSNRSMNAMYLGRHDGSFVAVVRADKALTPRYNDPVLRAKVVTSKQGVREIQWREYTLGGKSLNQWTDDSDDYDPRMRAWYQDAQNHELPVWTNAFSLNNSKKLAIAASVKLRDRNGLDAGVLGVSVELAELSALVSAIPLSKHAAAVILDNNLNEIATSSNNEIAGELSAVPSDYATSTIQGFTDGHWFSKNDSLAHLQRRIVLFDGALHWRLLLVAPVSDYQPSNKDVMMEGMYSGIAIILVPGFVALLIILGLSKPLQGLYRRATIDYLTRAFNREEFINRFSKRLAKSGQASSRGYNWVAVALDLDGFKQINDKHGHDAGDAILKTVVARMQKAVGSDGFVGRLGGDEFAIALKVPSSGDARTAVERIRRCVVTEQIKSGRAILHIGMTAGVATVVDETESVASLLERADRALVAGRAIAKNSTYCDQPATVHSLPVRPVQAFGERRAATVIDSADNTAQGR